MLPSREMTAIAAILSYGDGYLNVVDHDPEQPGGQEHIAMPISVSQC